MPDRDLAFVPRDVFVLVSAADARVVADLLRRVLVPSVATARVSGALDRLAPYLQERVALPRQPAP